MRRGIRSMFAVTAVLGAGALAGCGFDQTATLPACAPDDGGIDLPDGFCAVVVADEVGAARHVAVAPNGDVFVALRNTREEPGGVLALRDTTGDGRADLQHRFGPDGGTGIALAGERLYFGTDDAVLRYRIPAGSLEPAGSPDTIVAELLNRGSHSAKSIAVRDDGRLFVNIGAPSNACQVEGRTPGSPGQDPCPLLEMSGGIWSFDANQTGQTQADGERYATGLRNVVALGLDHARDQLYGVQHGRDQLGQLFSDVYTNEDNAEKPAEEFFAIDRGDDFGWPYCYYDPDLDRKVLGPEYGGDGAMVGRCADKEDPIAAFPAHWAPNGVVFYGGDQFPDRYRAGAFVAFHGSWNRAPLPQGGYNVVFVPFRNGSVAGEYEVFAAGFAGEQMQPGEADHRPSGVTVGPDGSLYVADDSGGRIWRVMYQPR